MSEPTPNDQQQEVIESINGVHLVDAGAGTGKTFAITRRYAHILAETTAVPQDILLMTFTRSAASEMRDRIVAHTDYDVSQLQHAPISTFHAYGLQLLRRYGHDAPQYLGIDDQIASSIDIVEDEVREGELFRQFLSGFADDHPEYDEFVSLLYDRSSLRSLVTELAAKGVVPAADGWYRDSGDLLTGDRENFFEEFERANTPNEGANSPNNSDARSAVGGWDATQYCAGAPDRAQVHDGKRVNREWVKRAFDEDRSELLAFVHDVYFEYLEFLLERNLLTHGFVLVLSYVLLCENDPVREAVGHEYVMVDEFQDTNEIQFKITLLLSATNNICVVGDWKQSIYGFQYTSVENIQEFDSRIARYKRELNTDRRRIDYPVDDVRSIPLVDNYRSTESIINHAEETLFVPASSTEEVDETDIENQLEHLEATNAVDNSRIAAYTADDEYDLVLDRILEIQGNEEFAVEVTDEPSVDPDAPEAERVEAERERLGPPSLEDIAVLTRKRDFARELLRTAEEYDIPVAYEGGLELFDTPEAKLVLAWLRICETDDERGWAVALERAGYPLERARRILEKESYPDDMVAFREELRSRSGIAGLARRVLERYGRDSTIGDALVEHLASTYEGRLIPRGEVIDDIVQQMDAGSTVEIDTGPGSDAVTLQTIHSVKGLEYPIVILANVNRNAFPHYGRGPGSPIVYDETYGLRQRRCLSEFDGGPYVCSHWQYDILKSVLPSSYAEERRLFYVATTRARRHLLLTAGETPSPFFEQFPVSAETVSPAPREVTPELDDSEPFVASVPEADQPLRTGVHSIMDDSVFEDVTEGRGPEFGQAVHDFAEAYAEGESVTPDNSDQEFVAEFVDDLNGTKSAEKTVLYPLGGDPSITLTGIVDLLHVTSDRIDIVDYKTDLSRRAHGEYRLQLSVYYHVLNHVYPDREIRSIVFYTADGEPVQIEPFSKSVIEERARDRVL